MILYCTSFSARTRTSTSPHSTRYEQYQSSRYSTVHLLYSVLYCTEPLSTVERTALYRTFQAIAVVVAIAIAIDGSVSVDSSTSVSDGFPCLLLRLTCAAFACWGKEGSTTIEIPPREYCTGFGLVAW